MARNTVLQWKDGNGWLVLAGGENNGEIAALALGRLAADGGIAYLMLGAQFQQKAEHILADMDDLGSPPGYLVDVMTEDDDTIRQKLGEAGMIVITGGESVDQLRNGLLGAAADGIQTAYENGALVLAQGPGAMVFGNWVILRNGEHQQGLGWLENSLILPDVTSIAQDPQAKALLAMEPAALAVGIGLDSALALGPNGELEIWGNPEVTIALGQDYSAQ